jgi:hypothetical protein
VKAQRSSGALPVIQLESRLVRPRILEPRGFGGRDFLGPPANERDQCRRCNRTGRVSANAMPSQNPAHLAVEHGGLTKNHAIDVIGV